MFCLVIEKFEGKYKKIKIEKKTKTNKKWRIIENIFKFNKLFLYTSLNLFYLFSSIIWILNNLNIYNFW